MVRLMSNPEELYFSGRPSWLNQVGSFGSITILLLMPFFAHEMTPFLISINILASLMIMSSIVYSHYAWEFRVSDGEVQSQHGIKEKKQKSLRLKGIRKIEVKQTTIQRMFGVGDIIFSAAGGSSDRVIFCGVESPAEFKDKVLKMQRKKGS